MPRRSSSAGGYQSSSHTADDAAAHRRRSEMTTAECRREEEAIVDAWVHRLNDCLEAEDFPGAAALFARNGYLRDLVALTWHFHTYRGRSQIEAAVRDACTNTRPSRFHRAPGNVTKRKTKIDGTTVIETVLGFETIAGVGQAVLRLVTDPQGDFEAWVLSTALYALKGHPERVGEHRPVGRSRPTRIVTQTFSWSARDRAG
jgi:putative flavoprotein involved in K+ transport